MAEHIPIATTAEELADHLSWGGADALARDAGVLCQLGGGILKFAEAVYPGMSSEQVYVDVNQREPEGRGAHFDVYGPYVHGEAPWIAAYNLSGRASVRTTTLTAELSAAYSSLHPEPNDAAFQARRHFAYVALGDPNAKIYHGLITPGAGLVLPQPANGPHIVHDVVPTRPLTPGSFVKLVVPNGSQEAADKMAEGGYVTLDELASKGIGALAVVSESNPLDTYPPRLTSPPASPWPARRRRCNLD